MALLSISQADLDLLFATSQEALLAKDRVIRDLLAQVDAQATKLASQADEQQLAALRDQAAACSRDANENSAQLFKAKKALQKALTTVKERTDAIDAAHEQIAALKKQLAEAHKAKSPSRRGKPAAVLAENQQGLPGAEAAELQRLRADNARLAQQLVAMGRGRQLPAEATQAFRQAEQLAADAQKMQAAVDQAMARIKADAARLTESRQQMERLGRTLLELTRQQQNSGGGGKKQAATRSQLEGIVRELTAQPQQA